MKDKRGKSLRVSAITTQIMGELISLGIGICIFLDYMPDLLSGIIVGVIVSMFLTTVIVGISQILYNLGVIYDKLSDSGNNRNPYAMPNVTPNNGFSPNNPYARQNNVNSFSGNRNPENRIARNNTVPTINANITSNAQQINNQPDNPANKKFRCPKCGNYVAVGQDTCFCGTKFDWNKLS